MILVNGNRSVDVMSITYQDYEFQFDSEFYYGILSNLEVIKNDDVFFYATVQMAFPKNSDRTSNYSTAKLYTITSIFDQISMYKSPKEIFVAKEGCYGFYEYHIDSKLFYHTEDLVIITTENQLFSTKNTVFYGGFEVSGSIDDQFELFMFAKDSASHNVFSQLLSEKYSLV